MATAAYHWYTVPDGNGGRKRVRTKVYYAFYKDHRGVRVHTPGFKEKALTQKLADKLEREAQEVRAGVRPPPPPKGRKRRHDAGNAPGGDLTGLVAEFLLHLAAAKGVSLEYRQHLAVRLGRAFDGLTRVDQITGDHVEGFLGRLREAGRSAQTRKHYLVHAKQFTRWLVRKKKLLAACPLADIPIPKVRAADRKHVRRAEGPEFLSKLVASVRAVGKVRKQLAAEARVWLYAAAAVTGLRAKELSELATVDVHLGDMPCVVLPGRFTKNGEDAACPLDPDTAAGLAAHMKTVPPGGPLWPGYWAAKRQAGKMLAADVLAAGLPYRDDRGRVFDFHALRMTFVTAMWGTNAPLAVVQAAARHSDPRLTANTYTDHRLMQGARYVNLMGLGRAFASAGPEAPPAPGATGG
jgi:integrase/recombinase XerC